MPKVMVVKELEPDLSKSPGEATRLDIWGAFNWYNVNFENEKAKEFALTYLKGTDFDKAKLSQLARVSPTYFIKSVGWVFRMLSRKAKLPQSMIDNTYAKIDTMIAGLEPETVETNKAPVLSIQDKTARKIDHHIAILEDEIDKLIRDEDHEFSAYEYFRKAGLKPAITRGIADYYIPLFNEYIDALSGVPEVKEGYSKLSKATLMKHMKFLEALTNDAEAYSKNVKKERAPRKKKPKSAEKQVSKLKFKATDDKYKVSSIQPADVIGAQQLWIFNSKTRMLGVYNAYGPNGFAMKGSTISGFDDKTSIMKKLRKPEVTLKEILNGGKVSLRKAMDSIKSKSKVLNGRINKDTILLRAVK